MRNGLGKFIAIIALCVTGAFSAEKGSAGNVPSLDLLKASVDSIAAADTVARAVAAKPDSSLKTVLYLGGGERSPWFQLGVFYAIEEYGIPVDSVVATSWGAWMAALWTRGVPLDDIQKIMLDPAIAPFVGHDLAAPTNKAGYREVDSYELPISVSGIPSMRKRFALTMDSAFSVHSDSKSLTPDSMQVVRSLAKLRFQESLYRQRSRIQIPFAVQSCESGKAVVVGNSTQEVIASLPLWKSPKDSSENVSGELCPYYAMPIEDNAQELSIIVVADPLRAPIVGDERTRLIKRHASEILASQPGIIVRAHTILDTARAAWIQSGFTSFEKQLGSFKVLNGRRHAYSADQKGAMPWFKFEPSYDSLSSEVQNAVKSYWLESDTGMVAPENFALNLLQNPAYDSLDLNMRPSGHVTVESSVKPVVDFAVGGFGSNAFGPNLYGEASVHYVDHVEIELVMAGFWGEHSYGFRPRLNISKLWNRHWDLQFGYDYLKLVPLKGFNGNTHRWLRILSEERSDLMMDLLYTVDSRQRVSAEFRFGSRYYDLDSAYYGNREMKAYPVSPMLHYRYLNGEDDNWFANNGYALNVWGGFESIGYDDGIIDVVPIYWKLLADARYTISPVRFVTLTAAAAGAIERYHDEGHGYVSPKSFDKPPLDVAYRQHAAATPWSTEWYNPELSSHEYAMVRLNGGLHGDYLGAWIFGAYYHDFEDSPYADLDADKFVFEPALRFAYKSVTLYAGLSRVVDYGTFGDLTHLSGYNYFVRVGNYNF